VGEDFREVLVAAAGKTDEHELLLDVEGACERVRALECRDDPLRLCEPVEGDERLFIGAGQILRSAGVTERSVLRPHARVVEPGGDRMGVGDLPVAVGENRRTGAVEDAGASRPEAGRASRLDADHPRPR